jgi:hypothetical protein
MTALRDFELEVIRFLAEDVLSAEQIAAIASVSDVESYEHTGCGYFVTVAHPLLPAEPQTLSVPYVAGHIGETECGFVAFLGSGKLTLECHPMSGPDVPADVRELLVRVAVEPINAIDLR